MLVLRGARQWGESVFQFLSTLLPCCHCSHTGVLCHPLHTHTHPTFHTLINTPPLLCHCTHTGLLFQPLQHLRPPHLGYGPNDIQLATAPVKLPPGNSRLRNPSGPQPPTGSGRRLSSSSSSRGRPAAAAAGVGPGCGAAEPWWPHAAVVDVEPKWRQPGPGRQQHGARLGSCSRSTCERAVWGLALGARCWGGVRF